MNAPERSDVVFIPGLWVHSSSWRAWSDAFSNAGYRTHSVGWPGESADPRTTRMNPALLNGTSIDDITNAYANLIATLPAPPVVVGHSFGGLVAQKLLVTGVARAAVALSPAPIQGVKSQPFAQVRSALPVLSRPWLKNRSKALSRRQFRYSFGNAVTRAESDRLYDAFAIPGPGLPLFELTGGKKDLRSPTAVDVHADRGPLLILGADADHTIPAVVSAEASRLYAASPAPTDYRRFEGRGHSYAFDSGNAEIIRAALDWLAQQKTRPVTTRSASTQPASTTSSEDHS